MRKLVLLLSVVSFMSIGADGRCRDEGSCSPTPISCATTIKKAGCYCLTKNICGKITIAHNDVTLDLNCHKVNGAGESAAICVDGHSNITIKNGSVCNLIKGEEEPLGFGIDIRNSTDVTLEDLNVVETDPVGVQLIDTIGITIRGCDFSKNDQALLLSSCSSGKIECCKAYNNENTANEEIFSSAVVSIEFSDCIDVVDFDVCDNVKARTISNFAQSGIFQVATSTNVNLKRCKLNSNSLFREDASPVVVGFTLTSNCSAIDCQANSNVAPNDNLTAMSTTFSSNFTCVRSQANSNETRTGVVGFAISGVDGYIQEGCQASNNSATADGGPFVTRPFVAIFSSNGVVRDCSANENSSNVQGEGYTILSSSNIQMLNFQANNNSGTLLAVGICSFESNNIDIIGCQINNTNSTFDAFGIWGNAFSGLTIEGCEVNNTTSLNGIAAGIISTSSVTGVPGTQDLRIVNCVVQGTNSTNNLSLGIAVDGIADGAENAVIKCCQVYDTVSSGPGAFATGIGAADTNDVSIQNCQVYDTRGNGFAAAFGITGLTLTGVTNLRCNIEGCEAHNTTTELAGFGVGIGFPIGTSDVCTVKDCTALGNELGFADFSGNNNFFAGNYAEANAVDYAVLPLPIVYTKSTGTFGSTPNRWSNIQAIP